ncbi:hypothetical protein PR202_gn00568 [Eleusine coracana subsp. coracana]|uniref:Uncharacterized protein n=1 Tax=Eleusine coracana subsp. coracana TaxID=191504 RepID=A0AAV5G245_ELECO|nr:hypothetical protein PR202_gn00568 [Eleusine coracana subsp. coracana]
MCKYNLPPGPRPWPVIGNLNLIGSLPHRSIHELSKHYGPYMSLRLGSFPVVVGSSINAARFILKTNDQAFIDRPRTASGKYIHYNYSDMLCAPYGAYWRQARKLFQTEILSARQLSMLEDVRVEEVRAMLTDLHAAASTGHTIVLKDHLHMVSLNVISRMVLGKKYVVEEEASGSPVTPAEFRWMINEGFFLSGVLNAGEHNNRRRQEGQRFVAKDMVDLLLQLSDDPNLEVPIDRDGVKSFILDLIGAGTDTSSVTVEWAMSELLKAPEALAKATEELDHVIGGDRFVTEADIPSLPYVEAIVKERCGCTRSGRF